MPASKSMALFKKLANNPFLRKDPKKIEIANAKGVEIINAMPAVINVPTKKDFAPNSDPKGSQIDLFKKAQPLWIIAGKDRYKSVIKIHRSNKIIKTPFPANRILKIFSNILI